MDLPWSDAPGLLAGLLRRRGLEPPDRVDNVQVAWESFCDFLALPVGGLEKGPDSDADGFIIQWGHYGWNDDLPSLSFTRQFAVDVRATRTEPETYQPSYWHVGLDLVFADGPPVADLDQLEVQNTGFDFSPPGPERDRAIARAESVLRHYSTLRELWSSTPLRGIVTLDQAD